MWGARTPSGLRCRRRTGGHRRPGGGGRAAGTNPSLGRGVSPGLRHVAELAAVVCAHLDAPAELSRAWLELTESRLAPWYRVGARIDNDRYAQSAAAITGGPALPASAGLAELGAPAASARYDPDVFRDFLETGSALSLARVVRDRPDVMDRVRRVGSENEPLTIPGPDREALTGLIGR